MHLKHLLLSIFCLVTCSLLVSRAKAQDLLQDGYSVHVVSWGETLTDISHHYGVPIDTIMVMNNIEDENNIYVGQRLIIPINKQGNVYIVQSQDTLSSIAERFDLTLTELQVGNHLQSPDRIYIGQVLFVETPTSHNRADSSPQMSFSYIVQPGDTLYSLALRNGLSVEAIVNLNSLINESAIFSGQTLLLPRKSPQNDAAEGENPPLLSRHYVNPNETLSTIATHYNVSISSLMQINNLSNPSLIYVGQILSIPPAEINSDPPTNSHHIPDKQVIVDISQQIAYVYEGTLLVRSMTVSTGIPGRDTWRGNFAVQNRQEEAYAATWDLRMPYWVGFYWAGTLQNGFHALPILSNGVRLWDGLLGQPASYGCVILSDLDARWLYNWVEIGTPVNVQD